MRFSQYLNGETIKESVLLEETRNYKDFINRKKKQYGDKFDDSDLSKQFIPYFENQKRIEVDLYGEDKKRGRVGVTTGWKPVFLLMLSTRSTGSAILLSDKDKIIKVVSEGEDGSIMEASKTSPRVKTKSEWNKSHLDLTKFLSPGDMVDDDIIDYAVEVLPPHKWTADVIQIGEPYGFEGGKKTWITFEKKDNQWHYAGIKI